MKLLTFHYHLKIRMDAPVRGHQFTLRYIPVSDERQRILHLEYYVSPCDYLSEGQDQWGNTYLYGAYRGEHSGFEANISGKASVGMSAGTASKNPERDNVFRCVTPLTRPDDGLRQFAEKLSVRSGSPEEAAAVMNAIHDTLSYRPGSTTAKTTAAEAFAQGLGVCQDYSHVMLSVLRSHGIAARYAAGMLLGEGESHAWVEVLYNGIWTGYDPTNNQVVSENHIKLSHGRDAWDCAINRGIFHGSVNQKTEISVIVSE